jgi:hypothetical protein
MLKLSIKNRGGLAHCMASTDKHTYEGNAKMSLSRSDLTFITGEKETFTFDILNMAVSSLHHNLLKQVLSYL